MKHLLLRISLMLAAVVTLGESTVRAEFADFSYSWSVQPGPVIPGGTGSIQFALAPNASAQATIGAATQMLIPGATLTTTSSASPGEPDSYSNPFTLKLSLKDAAS